MSDLFLAASNVLVVFWVYDGLRWQLAVAFLFLVLWIAVRLDRFAASARRANAPENCER